MTFQSADARVATPVIEAQIANNRKQEVGRRLDGLHNRLTKLTGFEDPDTKTLINALNQLRGMRVPTMSPLLPMLFQLKGEPYRLKDHFPFGAMFRMHAPQETIVMAGRQTAKSTSLAAHIIAQAISIPHFNTLCVTPLFEMIRRFSQNYVRDLIENSPMRRLLTSSNTSKNVLQRSFVNGSTIHFSYAFLDADRTRGLSVSKISYDEVQDLSYDFIPIINETLSASPWKVKIYAGTPKSLDNTIAALHQDSSQAEWVIKCQAGGCGHYNVPALTHDLWDMIGPLRDDISEKSPGIVCAKCRKPINPRLGRWIHAYPDRATTFAGYHIPQIIMPMHYADKNAWAILLNKMAGHGNMTRSQFLNEVCGVASDEGSKLVTLTDLRAAACLPWKNDWRESEKKIKTYRFRVLAVDWGGGGGRLRASAGRGRKEDKRLRSSFTTLAVLGLRPGGRIHVLWGYRSLRTHDFEWEARLCMEAMAKFRCSHLVHDYSNAGAAREVLIRQAGWPAQNIMPLRYHGAASHGAISYHPATDDHPRDWYSLDRSYTLLLTCQCIKHGIIQFFRDDYENNDNPGVLRDFLALVEEKMDSRVGTDVFTIQRNPNLSDDFAHSVNYGSCALWYMSREWPDLSLAAKMKLSPEVLASLHPQSPVDWNAI